MYKKTKKVYYRKKTASLTQKKIKAVKKVAKEELKPALKKENLTHHALRYLVVFLAVLAIFSLAQGALFYLKYQEVKDAYGEVVVDYEYWQKVVRDHPNFPDGYYNAAVYAGMLDRKDEAISYIRKAIVLDPEFIEAKELETKLAKE